MPCCVMTIGTIMYINSIFLLNALVRVREQKLNVFYTFTVLVIQGWQEAIVKCLFQSDLIS